MSFVLAVIFRDSFVNIHPTGDKSQHYFPVFLKNDTLTKVHNFSRTNWAILTYFLLQSSNIHWCKRDVHFSRRPDKKSGIKNSKIPNAQKQNFYNLKNHLLSMSMATLTL